MAQAPCPSGKTNNVLCRYFMCGVCREGKNCRFSHDTTAAPDLVCRFYLKGQCAYGDRCRYDHVRDRKQSQTSPKDSKQNAWAGPGTAKSPPQKQEKPNQAAASARPATRSLEPLKSNLVPLGKNGKGATKTEPSSLPKAPEDWVKAKEFVPGQFYDGAVPSTYAKAVGSTDNFGAEFSQNGDAARSDMFEAAATVADPSFLEQSKNLLCPYFAAQTGCPYKEDCVYLHGEVCEMCGLAVLHPSDEKQRQQHQKECMEEHERDMELSFAIAKSREQTCGICMEVVLEKEPVSEQRFGILENCNHCYCLSCIRKWRCAKQFEKVIVRACPQCRVKSDFVTPSSFWVDSPEEKTKLIEGYKKALKEKPCRHFDQGRGDCPFNDKCFYRHALPDGTLAPPQPRRPRRRHNADGEAESYEHIRLWDFLEANEMRRQVMMSLEEDLAVLVMMNMLAAWDSDLSSDDDSDSDF